MRSIHSFTILLINVFLVIPTFVHADDQHGISSLGEATVDANQEWLIKELLGRLDKAEDRIHQLETHQGESIKTSLPEQMVEQASHSVNHFPMERLINKVDRLEREWHHFQNYSLDDLSDEKPTFELGGRIHLDHWNFLSDSPGIGFFEHPDPLGPDFGNDPQDRFVFRRIRLEFKGDLPSEMFWRMQVDFNNVGEPEYKDVYIGFKGLPHNQRLMLGNQKRPIGLDHLNSSRFNVFTERPLVVEAFNEDARRLGWGLWGHSDDESCNWALGMYELENTSRDGRATGDSLQWSLNARLSGTPYYENDGRNYWHVGVAGMLAQPDGMDGTADLNENEGRFRTRPEARSTSRWLDTGRVAGADWYEIVALESILNIGPLQITGEYMNTWMQRDNVTPGTGPDLHFHGAYIYAAYFLTGEYMPIKRSMGILDRARPRRNFRWACRGDTCSEAGWGAFQIAARYGYLDLTSNDIRGGIGHNTTIGLNWYWTAYSKLQMNFIYTDIHAHRPVGGFENGHAWIMGMRWMADF